MRISDEGLKLIKRFEGLSLKAYPDPATKAEPYTIGFGSTLYPDGKKVKLGEVISMKRAEDLLRWECDKKGVSVQQMLGGVVLNQNQYDALVSFAYNCGVGALQKSTLLKKIKQNPNDPTIRDEFNKWVKAAGKTFPGLVKRRKQEADLYFLT